MTKKKTSALEQLERHKHNIQIPPLAYDAILELAERVEALEAKPLTAQEQYKLRFGQDAKYAPFETNDARTIELPDDTFDELVTMCSESSTFRNQPLMWQRSAHSDGIQIGSVTFIRAKKESEK